jgi:probable HAF family extracellular repeat protein
MRRLLTLICAALGAGSAALAEDPARKYHVVAPKDDGILATGINERGDVIGFEWMETKDLPDVLQQVPFYRKGNEMTYLPLLAGYTATFPAGVSDLGLVVGRASKPAPRGVRVHLRNQAFVWDAKGGIRGLGALEGDSASVACGVSRDGCHISGYSVGDNRLRACVWDRDGDAWKGTALAQKSQFASPVIAISGSGRYVAAVDESAPCLWTRDESGAWTREVIGEAESLVPRAVNDSGSMAGVRFTPDGMIHAVVWSRQGGLQVLTKPAGYVRSEAHAINNHGAVVGIVDGPNGSQTGPNAFVYEDGRLRILDEGGPNFTSATAINDRGDIAGIMEKSEDNEPVRAKPSQPEK